MPPEIATPTASSAQAPQFAAPPQAPPSPIVQAAQLIASGDLQAWEHGYYTVLFHNVMRPKTNSVPLMQFDYANRRQLYEQLHKGVVRNRPMDYLEFGVYQGASLRAWTELNTHPQSRFFGFDSFEGLPEDWPQGNATKGAFCCDGRTPNIDDSRVQWVKGWFNETLPDFLATYTPQRQLVLHLDADLYSSTLTVLMQLSPHLTRGTLLVFDEFLPLDEFAAFYHFLRATGRDFHVVAAREDLVKLGVVLV